MTRTGKPWCRINNSIRVRPTLSLRKCNYNHITQIIKILTVGLTTDTTSFWKKLNRNVKTWGGINEKEAFFRELERRVNRRSMYVDCYSAANTSVWKYDNMFLNDIFLQSVIPGTGTVVYLDFFFGGGWEFSNNNHLKPFLWTFFAPSE